MRFFFDNDISPRVVCAIKCIANGDPEVTALREMFEQATPDRVWIPEVTKRGWIIVSRDFRQRRNRAEHQTLRTSGARAIYIRQRGNQEDLYSLAGRIISMWPKLIDWGETAKPGELAQLNSKNVVELLKS
ncbi:MAG: hypothetical protein ACK4P3_09160 [Fimbriimonadaceae bacterium]